MNTQVSKARKLHQERIPAAKRQVDALTAQRDGLAAQLNDEGMPYSEIADALGVSLPYVQVMVQRHRGTLSPSRQKIRRASPEVR